MTVSNSTPLIKVLAVMLLVVLMAVAAPAHAQQTPVVFDSVFTTQPVRLVSFTAQLYSGGGQLHWVTMQEGNSAAFGIEQSSDALTWQALATMPSHPNYPTRYDYVYMDLHVYRYGVPVVYYRVRQTAQDGTFTFSPVRSIRLGEATARNAKI